MRSLSRNFARLVIRYRITFISSSILFSLFFLYNLKDLSIHTNVNDLTPQNHPYMQVQKKLISIFGGLNQVSIALAVKEGDIFQKETLEKVVRITRKLYLMEGVNSSRIVSLSGHKTKDVRATETGFITKRLMREAPETKEGMEYLKHAIRRNPMLYGPVVSKDLKATLILADFEPHVPSKTLFREIKKIVEVEKDKNHEIYMAGRPILEGWLDFYLPNMFRVLLVTGVIILFLLYLAFRSKRGVILPIISATMATIWGLGIISLLGYKLDAATMLAPFLILALDICHSVQFIKRYYEEVSINQDGQIAAENTLSSLFIPAIASLITDSLGFLTLFLIPIPIIKSMSLAAGIGAISSFFTTVTFIPPLLAIMPLPKRSEVEREEKANVINWVLAKISCLSSKSSLRWLVIITSLILASLGIFGTSKIVVGDNETGSSALYPDSPYNISEEVINTKFSGSNPYFILVEGIEEKAEAMISSSVLKEMDSLQRYLKEKIPEAGYTISLTDYIKGLNMTMEGGNFAYFQIPDNDTTIAEYLFLYSISGFPGDFDPVVSSNYQYANIKMDLKDHRASTINKVMSTSEEWIRNYHHDQKVRFLFPGGVIGIMAAVNQVIDKSLPANVFQISVITFLCVVVSYASLLSGFLLLLPLALGVFITFGVFGLLGITLTIETLPIASVGIGLGVDYGLYVVSRLKDEIASGENPDLDEAILKSLVTSGKALIFSGTILSIGVFAWAFSDIKLQAKLGIALGSLIILNVLGALIILPVLIRMIRPRFIFKLKDNMEAKMEKSNAKVYLTTYGRILLMVSTILLMTGGSLFAEEKSLLKKTPPECPKCCESMRPQPGMSADDLMRIKYYVKYTKFARDVSFDNVRNLLIDKGGFTREKDAQRFRIILNRVSDDLDYKDLITLTAPQNVKGLSVLTWSYLDPRKDQDIWLWLPSLRKVRRISQAEADDAAFGSDLTQEEMTSRRWDDESYAYVGEKKFEGFTSPYNKKTYYAGQDCYVVEAKPKRKNWYYSKRVVWLHKEFGGKIFDEVYDAAGRKYKTVLFVYEYWPDTKCIPQVFQETHNLLTGHSTISEIGGIKFNTGLDENFFSEKTLMRTKW